MLNKVTDFLEQKFLHITKKINFYELNFINLLC
jgi:hypothetical protein